MHVQNLRDRYGFQSLTALTIMLSLDGLCSDAYICFDKKKTSVVQLDFKHTKVTQKIPVLLHLWLGLGKKMHFH